MVYHTARRLPDGTPGAYASPLGRFVIAHETGYAHVPRVEFLERQGWVKVREVPGLPGLWVLKRADAD
jgi:hypothetical protein